MSSPRVELLVSVRSCEEIPAALAGGCDLLDFKEPQQGALGMVPAQSLQKMTEYCHHHNVSLPLSMALGELDEWKARQDIPRLPGNIRYLKLGLSRIQHDPRWNQKWLKFTERIEAASQKTFEWIAVAYADWESAGSVSPLEVLTAAIENRCAGLLIDTYEKRGSGLTDLLSHQQLETIITQTHSQGLKIALAGSIRLNDLERLSDLEPDIIGIRGTACEGSKRTNRIQEAAVDVFRKQLDQQFACSTSG